MEEDNISFIKLLHVLTLSGRNGEYGGPVRVAREISKELTKRGHSVEIFSGARRGSEPVQTEATVESYIHVRPILRALPLSSLWNFKIIPVLWMKIRKTEIIHIHFARDLIPFTAAIIALLQGKPYIAQTHGMIISDGRKSTSVIDFLLTKPLLNRSKMVLVLTEIEFDKLRELNIKPKFVILPNGIEVLPISDRGTTNEIKRIIFCSRLQKRKGIEKFVDLAEHFKAEAGRYVFEIFGPDGGELENTLNAISKRKLDNLKYKGALSSEKVAEVLKNADLLVLPSKDEPYPMVVLETLSVGTPVLVMPSCGLAKELYKHDARFVATSESVEGLIESFLGMENRTQFVKNTAALSQYCKNTFGISSVVNRLETIYRKVMLEA